MLRISVLVLAVLFLVGCGGGIMPTTPPHNGSSGGTDSSSGSSGSDSSGTGTSSTGSSGSGTSSSGSSDSGSSGSGSSGGGGGTPTVTGPSTFTFSGYTWETHSGSAPPAGNANGNVGTFDPMNVSVGSELVLSLTQTQNGSQVLSSGSEVMTQQKFSYGTFEFTSRVAGVYSGSITTGFLYAPNSETEIDMEQVGNKTDAVDCTNWRGVSNFQDTQVFGFDQGNSHDFKIVWQPGFVDWYVDGQLVVHHTQAVPSVSAPFLFSAWGTNKSTWGGMATIGPTRYMYVSSFRYTP